MVPWLYDFSEKRGGGVVWYEELNNCRYVLIKMKNSIYCICMPKRERSMFPY